MEKNRKISETNFQHNLLTREFKNLLLLIFRVLYMPKQDF